MTQIPEVPSEFLRLVDEVFAREKFNTAQEGQRIARLMAEEYPEEHLALLQSQARLTYSTILNDLKRQRATDQGQVTKRANKKARFLEELERQRRKYENRVPSEDTPPQAP